MTTGMFLRTYTAVHTGPESGLPVVTLKPAPGKDAPCPFVDSGGCRVYEDRPAACRIYPLARMISRNRQTGEIREHYACIREPHCRGFNRGPEITVGEYLRQEGVLACNAANDLMMNVIALKNRYRPGPLDPRTREGFYRACYDLDAFLDAAEKRPDFGIDVEPKRIEAARSSDDELMRLGLGWIERRLFAVGTGGADAS
jgi:hypothetical protein